MATQMLSPRKTLSRMRVWQYYVGAMLCSVLATTAARGDTVDLEITRQAPKVIRYLRDKHYRNVGILTFRIQRPGDKSSYSGSLMNNNMADRWERALVLSMDPEKDAIDVISQARKTAAARVPDANYRTPNDRKRLFGVKYPLAYASQNRAVSADVFLTGSVSVSENFATTTVSLDAFDRAHPEKYTQVLRFDVPTDRYVLADLGQGFSLSKRGPKYIRGALEERDGIQAIFEQASANSRRPASTTENASELVATTDSASVPATPPETKPTNPGRPTATQAFPVDLTMSYDGVVQSLQADTAYDGACNWLVVAPEKGQKVFFDVRNLTAEKLGIVVTVNGVNTLYEEQGLEPSQMARWVLEPNKQYRIQGFCQKDLRSWRPLEGLSEEESQQRVGDLGGDAHAGLIHLYVFRTVAGVPEAPKAQANLREVPPEQLGLPKPRNLSERKKQIAMAMAAKPSRGLMAPTDDVQLQDVERDTLDSPVLTDHTVIRYWCSPVSETPAPTTAQEQ